MTVARWTGPARRRALEGGLGLADYTGAQLAMLLVAAPHDYTTQQTVADVVADELAAPGYARQPVENVAVALGPDQIARASHDLVDFGILGAGFGIAGAYVFDSTGADDSQRELLVFLSFEGTTDNTTVVVQPSTPAIELS